MKWLVAIVLLLGLRWIFRDRRTPDQKLADADRSGDRSYLECNLPRLTEQETTPLIDRVVSEVADEFEDGRGDGEWDQARFDRYVFEERRMKYRRQLAAGTTAETQTR